MKKQLLISLFLLFVGLSATQAQVKIGYAVIDSILVKLPEYKEKSAELAKYQEQLQAQITEKETELDTKYKKYMQDRPTLIPIVIQQKEAELQRLQQELQQMEQGFQQDLTRYQAQLIQPIYLKVRESINEVAKEENFDLILNPSDGTGRSLLLFANEAYEITDKVLIKMGITP